MISNQGLSHQRRPAYFACSRGGVAIARSSFRPSSLAVRLGPKHAGKRVKSTQH